MKKQITKLIMTKSLKRPFKEVQWIASEKVQSTLCHYASEQCIVNTTVSYHFMPIRMAKIKKTDKIKCWPACMHNN